MQTIKTGGNMYSNTFSYEASECSLPKDNIPYKVTILELLNFYL